MRYLSFLKKQFSLCFLLLALSSCGLDEEGTSLPEWASIEFETDITQVQREQVIEAFKLPSEQTLDPAKIPQSEMFKAAFGAGADGVTHYLDDRINYFAALGEKEADSMVIAANPSSILWFLELRNELPPLSFNGKEVKVDSTRFGLILLGNSFQSIDSRMLRTDTLVHESRHSDCPGGISSEDLAVIQNASKKEVPVVGRSLKNPNCGFPHKICTSSAGPDLEGYPACEDQIWGPYAIEALYANAVAQSCTNCTARDLEHARILAIDAASRVDNVQAMFSGALGPPDMSSQGLH